MDNIKKVQPINFQFKDTEQKPVQKKAKKEKVYTILYYSDIIQLLINYQIPVAQVSVLRRDDIRTIFSNLYKDCSYFLKRKYDKFLPAIQETEQATLRKFSQREAKPLD